MEQKSMIIATIMLVLVGLVIGGWAIFIRKKYKRKPNYKAFFIIGITWIPLGITTQTYMFSFIGLLFLVLGLVNKKHWKNRPKWNELSPQEKRMKIWIFIFLSVIFLFGIFSYFMNYLPTK